MADKKTYAEQCEELNKAFRDLKQAIKTEMLDPITRPIFSYLAFKDTMTRIRAVIPPKHHRDTRIVTKTAKCLPRDLRGAYIHLVQDKVMSNRTLAVAAGESLTEIMEFKSEPVQMSKQLHDNHINQQRDL